MQIVTTKWWLFLTITLSGLICIGYAGDFHINPGQSIQTAIDSASYGDNIYVAAGTYIENITLKNGVSVIGDNAETTILDGNQNGPVVTSSVCDPNTLLSDFTIRNGFSGNGGGFKTNSGNPAIHHCIFTNNTANYCGGGVYIGVGCAPQIFHCIFYSNSADHGGAIGNSGFMEYQGPYPTIINCAFIGNTASQGGGMYNIDGCNPVLICCLFDCNSADEEGGGLCNRFFCNPSLINCTFHGNTATTYGGGIYNHYSSNPYVTNCILWENNGLSSGDEIYNSSSIPLILHSDIAGCGGSGTGWVSSLGTDNGGNIDDDPLFVDPNGVDDIEGTRDDNLRLSSTSPCIDMGDNTAVTVVSDFDGRTRILDGNCDDASIVDMGAYEYKPLQGDVNDDCVVDLTDFLDMSERWLDYDCGPCEGADLSLDGNVDLLDFTILTADWMEDLN